MQTPNNHRPKIDWQIQTFAALPSTNDYLKQLAMQGRPEGTVVIAREQTQGRGRRGRNWVSLPGKGLYMSLLFRPAWPPNDSGWLSIICATGVALFLENAGLAEVGIKWPNDVQVRRKKIAGILIEPRCDTQSINFAIAGIGLNLKHTEADFAAAGLGDIATSCAIEGLDINMEEASKRLLEQIGGLYCDDRSPLLTAWGKFTGRTTVPPID